MTENLVKKAIEMAGGVGALADKLGERYQTVQKWAILGRPPLNKVLAFEKATGGAVRRHELYPEEFGGYEPLEHDVEENQSATAEA